MKCSMCYQEYVETDIDGCPTCHREKLAAVKQTAKSAKTIALAAVLLVVIGVLAMFPQIITFIPK